MNTVQLNLSPKEELRYVKSWSHGGSTYKKRRKIKRPLLPGKVIHVVFKSSKAKGKYSFLANGLLVKSLLKKEAKRQFVVIQDLVNMGNHLHIKLKFKDREKFQNFLRTVPALLARKITGAKKGVKFGRFWDGLVFTRVLHSAFEELGLKGYFEANHRQREFGQIERESYLKNWNDFLKKLKKVRAKPK